MLEAVAGDDGMTDEERWKAEGVSDCGPFFFFFPMESKSRITQKGIKPPLIFFNDTVMFLFLLRPLLAIVRI